MANKIYDFWLNSRNVPLHIKQDMSLMSASEIEKSFNNKQLKFGTAGYRAIMGPGNQFLNEFTYQQLAYGYGKYLKKLNPNRQLRVIIGHDTRKNSLIFANVVMKTLTSLGIQVYLFKDNLPMPTPLVSYAVRKLNLDGAVNITASHNPKTYNGFKAYNRFGSQLLSSEADKMTQLIPNWRVNLSLDINLNNDLIKYATNSLLNDYLDNIKSKIGYTRAKKDKSPIVITTHHGVLSNKKFFDFLRSLGHNILPVYEQCYYDENFENSECMNPEDKKSFDLALYVAEKNNSDIMLGVDPDGDRLAVAIKHRGKWIYLNGNETGIITTFYLLNHKNFEGKVPIVISTYVSNNLVNEIIHKYDGLVLRCETGFKNIGKAMEEINHKDSSFILAFEEAIGMCIDDNIREKDGMSAAAIVIEMYKYYKQKGMTLVDLLNNRIYQEYGNWYGKTISIDLKADNFATKIETIKNKILKSTMSNIRKFKIDKIEENENANTIDFLMSDKRSWIKFRASGTEPKFKIYFNLFFDSNNGYDVFEYDHQKKSKFVEEISKELIDRFRIK